MLRGPRRFREAHIRGVAEQPKTSPKKGGPKPKLWELGLAELAPTQNQATPLSSGTSARWLAGEDNLKLLSSATIVEGYPAAYGRMQGIWGIALDIRGLARGWPALGSDDGDGRHCSA